MSIVSNGLIAPNVSLECWLGRSVRWSWFDRSVMLTYLIGWFDWTINRLIGRYHLIIMRARVSFSLFFFYYYRFHRLVRPLRCVIVLLRLQYWCIVWSLISSSSHGSSIDESIDRQTFLIDAWVAERHWLKYTDFTTRSIKSVDLTWPFGCFFFAWSIAWLHSHQSLPCNQSLPEQFVESTLGCLVEWLIRSSQLQPVGPPMFADPAGGQTEKSLHLDRLVE